MLHEGNSRRSLSAGQMYVVIALNLAVAVLSGIGTALSYGIHGLEIFKFYTVDSNIFAMLACAVYAAALIRQLVGKKEVPVFVAMCKYASVCCLAVTFIVVVAVLAPMYGLKGYKIMLLTNDMLYHHLLCPILAALSFFLFDGVPFPARKAARFALLPTAAYAAISVALNIAKVMVGPYPFLMVYKQPVYMSIVWVISILGGSYGFAWLLAKAKRHSSEPRSNAAGAAL